MGKGMGNESRNVFWNGFGEWFLGMGAGNDFGKWFWRMVSRRNGFALGMILWNAFGECFLGMLLENSFGKYFWKILLGSTFGERYWGMI